MAREWLGAGIGGLMGSGEGMAMGSGWRANGRATRSGWREWLTGWFWRGWGPESGKMGWAVGDSNENP
jgi:hypothetical protein